MITPDNAAWPLGNVQCTLQAGLVNWVSLVPAG